MIDFPIGELLDEAASLEWLEARLHPSGLHCPRCGSSERRLAKRRSAIPAYRCKACDRYHTMLSGTVFSGTKQTASTLVLLLRGIAKGESTARLSRELDLCRKQMHTIRHRVQNNLYESLPTEPMRGASPSSPPLAPPLAPPLETLESKALSSMEFEVDELYQNAGEKREPSRAGG